MSAFEEYIKGAPLSKERFGFFDDGRTVPENENATPETWTQTNWALTLQDRARKRVFDYVQNRLEKTDTHVEFIEDYVYVVWFSKTLQNWKALVSTTLPDGMYYEVTYNGDKRETYIDAYKKFDNVKISDDE